jgi:ComF family protein
VPKPFSLLEPIPAVFAEVADALASVFLPAGCQLCEKVLIRASRLPICDECLGSFALIGEKICGRCGLPLDAFPVEPTESSQGAGGELRCGPCRMDAYHFDRTRSVFRYEEAVVRAIVMLKFEEMEPLADWFAERLARRLSWDATYTGLDAVVPVPLHKTRHQERGFNQAEMLSKRLAKSLKLPHQGALLVRRQPRPNKHLLTERERWDAVRSAFATIAGSRIDKKRVLLVDDVMTTGATLDACAKVLRDAGAAEVYGLTVARAVLRNPRRVNV